MGTSLGSGGQRQAFNLDAEDFAAEEQNRAECLILGAGGDAPVNRQVRGVIPHGIGRDARVWNALALGQIVEEPPDPVGIAAFGAVGVVTGAEAAPQLLECR